MFGNPHRQHDKRRMIAIVLLTLVCGCGVDKKRVGPQLPTEENSATLQEVSARSHNNKAAEAMPDGTVARERMNGLLTLSLKVETFAPQGAWQLDVEQDGTAQLAIDSFSKPVNRKFTVSAKQLADLRELLIDQKFFELKLKSEYGDLVTDGSTRTITVALGGVRKTVTLNFLRADPSKVVEPARALRVWALVRGWFNDPQAVDLRQYDQRVIDAADAIDGNGGIQ